MREVTFKDFQRLMLKRRRTVDDLVEIFRGKLDLSGNGELGANDNSRSFFERLMNCKWWNPETARHEDRGDVVIPYRSVLQFYFEELHYLEDANRKPYIAAAPGKPACACGCGQAVFGRSRWASPGCKKKMQRGPSGTIQKPAAA